MFKSDFRLLPVQSLFLWQLSSDLLSIKSKMNVRRGTLKKKNRVPRSSPIFIFFLFYLIQISEKDYLKSVSSSIHVVPAHWPFIFAFGLHLFTFGLLIDAKMKMIVHKSFLTSAEVNSVVLKTLKCTAHMN